MFLLSVLRKMDDYLSKWMCRIEIFVELSLIGITKRFTSILFGFHGGCGVCETKIPPESTWWGSMVAKQPMISSHSLFTWKEARCTFCASEAQN
jgi:hypothetical protein